jgi:hypothetical protein
MPIEHVEHVVLLFGQSEELTFFLRVLERERRS